MAAISEARSQGSPALAPLPAGAPPRLIDKGLIHLEASLAGNAERYRRGETSHTIHVWWARRPHRAMRALVFACLADDDSADSLALLRDLSCETAVPPITLESARERVQTGDGKAPQLLDMFGGGGTIAFEAARLGADAHSIDSNQLSVFVQQCTLNIGRAFADPEMRNLLHRSGNRVLNRLKDATSPLFPLREQAFGYLWTYSKACGQCGYRFFLSKRPWLSKKRGRRLALVAQSSGERECMTVREVEQGFEHASPWTKRPGAIRCPRCGATESGVHVAACEEELVAIVGRNGKAGKCFSPSLPGAIVERNALDEMEAEWLSQLGAKLPATPLPRWSGIVNPALYGIDTHADFLNRRQRVVLLRTIVELRDEYRRIRSEVGEERARSLICLLSGLIDQLVDWNCRLSMWISQNEQVGRAFCGPGVAMLWDYVESDPVGRGPANLWSKLRRIEAGAQALGALPRSAAVQHACAQRLPFESGRFDAIVTDPPYYDNLFYNVLSDFFFSWKRLLLRDIDPLFLDPQTDSTHELVASRFRSGENAHEDYCRELGKAIREAERVLKADGVFALLYSHGSLLGWLALVRAYRPTNLVITSVQPLSIERKQRPRAMTSEAVNTCIVFVARHGHAEKAARTLDSMRTQLQADLPAFLNGLRAAGWHERDIGVAAYAHGVGMLANVREVAGNVTDSDALRAFRDLVRQTVPSFRVSERGFL